MAVAYGGSFTSDSLDDDLKDISNKYGANDIVAVYKNESNVSFNPFDEFELAKNCICIYNRRTPVSLSKSEIEQKLGLKPGQLKIS